MSERSERTDRPGVGTSGRSGDGDRHRIRLAWLLLAALALAGLLACALLARHVIKVPHGYPRSAAAAPAAPSPAGAPAR
ncbi:MAG TPA: hypothetical protein VFP72_05345 [Kineosporiaceae bacterium]|nr:hypothetical protein [Kineosporiaceae bacterium]